MPSRTRWGRASRAPRVTRRRDTRDRLGDDACINQRCVPQLTASPVAARSPKTCPRQRVYRTFKGELRPLSDLPPRLQPDRSPRVPELRCARRRPGRSHGGHHRRRRPARTCGRPRDARRARRRRGPARVADPAPGAAVGRSSRSRGAAPHAARRACGAGPARLAGTEHQPRKPRACRPRVVRAASRSGWRASTRARGPHALAACRRVARYSMIESVTIGSPFASTKIPG